MLGPTFAAIPHPPWSLNMHADTHICIGVSITPQPPRTATPTTTAPPPPAPHRYRLPDYGNTYEWQRVGAALLEHLGSNNAAITNGSAAEAVEAWMKALDSALTKTCAVPQRPAPSPSDTPHDAAKARLARASLANRNLPPSVVRAIRAAKDAALANLPQKRRLQSVAARALKDHHRQMRKAEASEFNETRRSSSHHFFNKLKTHLAPENTTAFIGTRAPPIPHEPGQAPPLERFAAFFKELYTAKGTTPPGASNEEWLKFIHPVERPPDYDMSRPFTSDELLPLIFPYADYSHYCCPASGTPDHQCTLCSTLKTQSANWRAKDTTHSAPPHHKPRGKAQAALNGPHLLAYLSWGRHPELNKREYRMEVCGSIASVLNKILAEEAMPPGTTNYRSIPLRKPAPPSTTPWAPTIPNWADPKSLYRFLSMSPLLTKVLCLAIDARTLHMVIRHKLINMDFQGASVPFMSTEWHAHAFLEAVKAEWKANRDVYALFVDFKKAYDNVSGEVLCATLKRLGFPPPLINLLAHWNATRTTTVQVNGESSEPIPTQTGVGQGDVFSCILYIIFINGLHNYLKSKSQGITPYNGVTLTASGFVDDVYAATNSLAAAQATVRAVHEWGVQFGHELQMAPNKTAILYLPQPDRLREFYIRIHRQPLEEDIPTIPEVATLANGTVVPFTLKYKYLGYWVSSTLPETDHLAKAIAYINTNSRRYFAYNSITRTICPTGTCQVLKTTCIPNYLASVIHATDSNINALDMAIHPLMRTMLSRLPSSTPLTFLASESNIPTARFLITRAILSTLLNLSISTYVEAPAVRLYHAQMAELAAGRTLPATSFLHRARAYLHPYIPTLGNYMDIRAVLRLPAAHAVTPSDATLAASVYARMICLRKAKGEFNALVIKREYTRNVLHFSQQPAAGPPKQMYFDLLFGLEHYAAGASYPSKNTPLSYCFEMGAALSARVTAELSRDKILALRAARLGACSMHYPPLGPATWRTTDTRSPAQYRAIARGTLCPLCEGAPADPFHVLCVCPHPVAASARTAALARATTYIPTLAKHIYSATPDQSEELTATYEELLALPPTPDWSTASGRALFYRLSLAFPWPEASVDDPNADHARVLGRLMDLTVATNAALHPIANSWVAWGSKSLLRMCKAWGDEVDRLHSPIAAPAP